jgi:glutamine phosphoribosylpyrophosphate amidotransferase
MITQITQNNTEKLELENSVSLSHTDFQGFSTCLIEDEDFLELLWWRDSQGLPPLTFGEAIQNFEEVV